MAEKADNTGCAKIFGLHLRFFSRLRPRGWGGKERKEIEFREDYVEVLGDSGYAGWQRSAGLSHRDLPEADGLEFAEDPGDVAGFSSGVPLPGQPCADPAGQKTDADMIDDPLGSAMKNGPHFQVTLEFAEVSSTSKKFGRRPEIARLRAVL